ncbi:unnamed protein product [Pipistrellus nathusii]|uniref:Uncharacterized protein n=1 Tax=Pipistrellus nathusii TaxID=59473 RepID=A0ABN9ZJF1_PIPNA
MGTGSSALGQNQQLTEHWRFLRKTSAQRLCPGGQRERRVTSISLFGQTFGETESLKVRTPGSPCVVSMTHRGTLPQCLNFPAHTMGLRDLGGRWGEDYKVSGVWE